jgi:hypothetical protein
MYGSHLKFRLELEAALGLASMRAGLPMQRLIVLLLVFLLSQVRSRPFLE